MYIINLKTKNFNTVAHNTVALVLNTLCDLTHLILIQIQ